MTSPRARLSSLGLSPSRSRGQNFLRDKNISDRLVNLILSETASGHKVLEIGPGLGALTRPLLDAGASVTAVELDRGLAAELLSWPQVKDGQLSVLNQDILKLTLDNSLPGPFTVCGNLPYNISTPLLFWFLEQQAEAKTGIFMIQKELAQRLLAGIGNRDYGRLSVALSLWYELKKAFDVPAAAFQPKPKVESTVVVLKLLPNQPSISPEALKKITAYAFHARRKTIINNLGPVYGREAVIKALGSLDISPNLRPENIYPQQYATLSSLLEVPVI